MSSPTGCGTAGSGLFTVAAEAYDRFMGRYSTLLAVAFADYAGIRAGRILDVGCGPGALTAELVRRVGAANVAAVEPQQAFAEAARERHPDADIRQGPAEELPFADGQFDAALAQLVVNFMSDPDRGAAEMRRVTHAGGTVAACVWDHGGGRGPLSRFWAAAAELEPGTPGEADLLGARQGQLEGLLGDAGLADVEETLLSLTVRHETFEDWWEPYTLGVGPPGAFFAGLEPDRRAMLTEHCRSGFPADGLDLTVSAWAARGRVP